MECSKKPKCRGCNRTGEEQKYFFQPNQRGKGGYLWHYSCYLMVAIDVNKSLGRSIEDILTGPVEKLEKTKIDMRE